jgi:hypothetical protein
MEVRAREVFEEVYHCVQKGSIAKRENVQENILDMKMTVLSDIVLCSLVVYQ